MKTEKQNNNRYRVQAIERALDILDCFTFQNREMTLSDITNLTHLNKTTAKRLVSNLTQRDYLQQIPSSKRYKLGMRLFGLGGIVFSSFSLRDVASHPMNLLQDETGATVLLAVMMDDQLVYLDKREGRGMIRISSDIGWRRPLHYGMLGHVLMAYLDQKEIERILKEVPLETLTPHSITDPGAFRIRLEEIRNQGYVVEREEAVEGIIGMAAPVKDYSRRTVAALGLALPTSQIRDETDVQHAVDRLRNAADNISSGLGYLKI